MTDMISSSSSPPFLMKVLSGARRKQKNKSRLKLNFARQSMLLLLTVVAVLTNVSMALNDKSLPKSCSEQNLPITVGGKRDDVAQCLVYEPESQLLITGGTTRSSDFGPANSPYGFLYAVDLEGDWVWGNYFFNRTQGISEITGCSLSSDGTQLVLLGKSRTQVVMAIANITTGAISNLYSLEDKIPVSQGDQQEQSRVIKYETYGAVHLDSKDYQDGKPYIYASFLMQNQQQLVKVLQAVPDRSNEFPRIAYHYSFLNQGSDQAQEERVLSSKIPQYMFTVPDSSDSHDSVYISGTYQGVGSVMKFYKKNAALRWHAELEQMTSVNAIAVHPLKRKGHFFGCGENNIAYRTQETRGAATGSEAWFFSMDSDGEATWMMRLSGSVLGASGLQDSCQGLVFDTREDSLVTVIETNSPQFKVQSNSAQKDTMLLEISTTGALQKVIAFTLGSSSYDMLGFNQNLVQVNDYFYMSGALYGFKTRKQSKSFFGTQDKNLDVFQMPLSFYDRAIDECVYERRLKSSDLRPFGDFTNEAASRALYKLNRDNNRDVPKINRNEEVYRVNYSKFVQSRPLRSSINTPRPCAFKSLHLNDDNPIVYYRGSEALKFNIADETIYDKVINQMDADRGGTNFIVDRAGQRTDKAAFTPSDGGKIGFFSNAVNQVGLNELTLRHCDVYERLFDLRLQVNVKRNSQPVFVNPPNTNMTLQYNQTMLYTLPQTQDPQGNADAQILIEPFEGYAEYYPPFMNVFNGNRTFEFVVNKEEYAGKQFFFKVILKEVGVNAIGFPYYFQVFVDPLDGGSENGGSSQDGGQSGSGSTDQDQTNEGGQSEGGQSGSDSQTGNGDNGQSSSEQSSNGENGVRRRGVVVDLDSYEKQQEDKFLFVETYTTDFVGRTQIKFTQQVDMERVERDFDELFKTDVLTYSSSQVEVTNFDYGGFNYTNQTVDVQFKFNHPFDLGLNTEKSDYVMLQFNESYPWNQILAPTVVIPSGKTLQEKARARIELTFDYEDSQMQTVISFSKFFMVIILLFIVLQLVLLIYKKVGFLTFWVLIDYAQLIAFLPLFTSRCVPYIYEAFRPFLFSHFIWKFPGDPGMSTVGQDIDAKNISFQAYNFSTGRDMGTSALFWLILLVIIIILDIITSIAVRLVSSGKDKNQLEQQQTQQRNDNAPQVPKTSSCMSKVQNWAAQMKSQFRYNIYIRYVMVSYLDGVFVAGASLYGSDKDVLSLKSVLAMLVLAFSVCVPFLVLIFLCSNFDKFNKDRTLKDKFNALLLKVDKNERWRIFLPFFYFVRRLMTAMMLILGSQNKAPAYLQFAICATLSAIFLFLLGWKEPYVLRRLNYYAIAMETIYFLLIMVMFSFTDATDDIGLKSRVAVVCIILLCLFFFSNILTSAIFARTGKATLKENDKRRKQFRLQEGQRRSLENKQRKDKAVRKKKLNDDKAKQQRLDQLRAKRDELRQQGMSEEDIDAKLPEEPLPQQGFKFGAIMGSRLIDYGIMSSSSDEDQPLNENQETEMTKIEQRRTSTALPTHDDGDFYEEDDHQFAGEQDLTQQLDTERLETEAPLTAQKLISNRSRIEDITGQTADRQPEPWLNKMLDFKQSNEGSQAPSSNIQLALNEEYDENLATDRPFFTEADDHEDNSLNVTNQVYQRDRQNPRRDDHSPSREIPFNNDNLYMTAQNITGQSSQVNILDDSRRQDEQIRRYADQL